MIISNELMKSIPSLEHSDEFLLHIVDGFVLVVIDANIVRVFLHHLQYHIGFRVSDRLHDLGSSFIRFLHAKGVQVVSRMYELATLLEDFQQFQV